MASSHLQIHVLVKPNMVFFSADAPKVLVMRMVKVRGQAPLEAPVEVEEEEVVVVRVDQV